VEFSQERGTLSHYLQMYYGIRVTQQPALLNTKQAPLCWTVTDHVTTSAVQPDCGLGLREANCCTSHLALAAACELHGLGFLTGTLTFGLPKISFSSPTSH